MTAPARLLAKSSRNPDAPRQAETLPGHLGSVVAAVRTTFRVAGTVLLDAMGLTNSADAAGLEAALLRAAILHDIGKANSHFQEAVRGNTPQA
ncbi:MAG TPA: CRISPR-associated helicase/endonuclease Cas3, partial [candidate division WOR-3 bacterium]|nr:CRISPR-associated helicase/endonuclease Cas3 [candidate division WOR-3 bacterium]